MRNPANAVVALPAVLGPTTVEMSGTQSLTTRGPRGARPAKVSSWVIECKSRVHVCFVCCLNLSFFSSSMYPTHEYQRPRRRTTQGQSVLCAQSASSIISPANAVVALPAVLGPTTVAMSGTRSLSTRGPRGSRPAFVRN